ncbi:transposase [Methylobacterium sp. R2-1]|nr:transposase [Methylobacterium sp. R2-1]
MSRKRPKPKEIVAELRQADVLIGQGTSVAEAIRAIGVSEVTYATSCWTERSSAACGRRRS